MKRTRRCTLQAELAGMGLSLLPQRLLGQGASANAAGIVYPWRATTALVKAGASVEQAFDGDTVHVVDVRVDVAAEGSATVSISP